jgi:MerR family mercuric resistance operon transcriptional regulator
VETIRFYQLKGLLPTPEHPCEGIRRRGSPDVARAQCIKTAQRLGLSLEEAGRLLNPDDGWHCREAAELAGATRGDAVACFQARTC